MKEVIPGIYHLPLPLPDQFLGHINTYLVRGDGQCLLIDTGWDTPEAFNSLQEQLAETGVKLEDIAQIIVTHIHPDHYGLAGRLKQLSGAKIMAHHLEKDLIESRYINMAGLLAQLEQWLRINGVPAHELFQLQTASLDLTKLVTPITPDIDLYGGETITVGTFSLRVLWAPGHSPGQICLHEPGQKLLFSGDHILADITPNIGLNPQSSPDPLHDYLNSLSTMKKLDAALILPGHGQPFTGLDTRIEELFHHHEERCSEILRALNATPKTAYQVATMITWMPEMGGAKLSKLESWDRRIAVMETLAHLEAMKNDGRLDKITKGDIIYYQPK
ncbi:MAG TPA: MBL fold metallo-hydrolase [Dehalococcoidia bacterium]|nr:MBL fold metallo-hydrolase [Dehalococcoidia bacterium]